MAGVPWDSGVARSSMPAEGMRVLLEPIPGLTKAKLLPRRGFMFQLPPLEEFTVNYAHSHTDYETLEAQQSRAGVPELATIQFSTLVMDDDRFDVNPLAATVENATEKLRDICLSGTPFLLTAAHQLPSGGYSNWNETFAGPEVQFPATLRSLAVTEKAGEGDARYLNVSFVEYRDAEQPAAGKGAAAKTTPPTTVKLYWDGHAVDAAGRKLADPPLRPVTLAYLAKKFYKDPGLAQRLGQANSLGNWGASDALMLHPRFKVLKEGKYGKLKIPSKAKLPRATG